MRLNEGELRAVVRDRGEPAGRAKDHGPLFAGPGLFSEEEPS